MAMFYPGQPITEEERRRLEIEQMFGIAPPPGPDPYADPMGPPPQEQFDPRAALREPDPMVAPDPMMQEPPPPPALAGRPEVPELPGAPEQVERSLGQNVGIGLTGLGDIAGAISSAYGGRPMPGQVSQTAAGVDAGNARLQNRNDRNWQQEVQNLLSNRRLGIAEQQEGRAQSNWQEETSAEGRMASLMHEGLIRRMEQGQLPGYTEEDIRKLSPREIEALELNKEAGTYRGVQQNITQADSAQERRMGEESRDAGEELQMLRDIGYPGAEAVNAEDPQTVARFVQVAESKMSREQRERLARLRAAKSSSSGGGMGQIQGLPNPADLYAAPKEDVHAAMAAVQEAKRSIPPGKSADMSFRLRQLDDLEKGYKDVEEAQLSGWEMIKPPPQSEFNRISRKNRAVENLNKIVNLIDDPKFAQITDPENRVDAALEAVWGLNPFSDANERQEKLRMLLEGYKLTEKDVAELGALAGPDMAILARKLGDPASFMAILRGRTGSNVREAAASANAALESELSTWYRRPGQGEQGGGTPAPGGAPDGAGGGLTEQQRARLEELRRKYR